VKISVDKMEYEDFYDLSYKCPHLENKSIVIEFKITLQKFGDVLRCNFAAEKLNKFFAGEVVNAVTFQHDTPDENNKIEGSFTASIPFSEKNFDLLLDLLILNLRSVQTVVFAETITISTETEKFIIHQKIDLKEKDKKHDT